MWSKNSGHVNSKDLIPEPEQSDLEQADLELFQLAAKQIKEKQFLVLLNYFKE